MRSRNRHVFVRLVHVQPQDDDTTTAASSSLEQQPPVASSSSSLISDLIPITVPIWDPFDFSSLAQAQHILRALSVSKSELVVELGYSLVDEGSTLGKRNQAEGDDALGWYLFGSGQGTGLVPMMLNRSCTNGGTAWVSFFACEDLKSDQEAIDLIAPFLPNNEKAMARGRRHDSWSQTIMVTSAKQLTMFLVEQVMSSISFQKRRSRLSFSITISNSIGETLGIVIANQRHFDTVQEIFLPRSNVVRDETFGLPKEGGSTLRPPPAQLALQQIARKHTMQRPPITVLRVPSQQRSDTLGVIHLIERLANEVDVPLPVSTTPAAELSSSTRTPVEPAPQPLPATPIQTANDEEVHRLQLQLMECNQNFLDVDHDMRHVLRSTEALLADHKTVRESLLLSDEELRSTRTAVKALEDHTRELKSKIQFEEGILSQLSKKMQDKRENIDAMLLKTAQEDIADRQRIHEEHARALEVLRKSNEEGLHALIAEQDSKLTTVKLQYTAAEEELRALTKHMDENISVSLQNHRTVEHETAHCRERLQQLEVSVQEVDRKIQNLDATESQWNKVESSCVSLTRAIEDLNSKIEAPRDAIKRYSETERDLKAKMAALNNQLREASVVHEQRREALLSLRRRRDALQRSAFFAEEMSCRAETSVEAERQRNSISRRLAREGNRFFEQQQALSVKEATNAVYEQIAAAQAAQLDLTEEIANIELRTTTTIASVDGLLKAQEQSLSLSTEECSQVLRRIEELRKKQKIKFLEREKELATLRNAYKNLMREFVVQVDNETSVALELILATNKKKQLQDPNNTLKSSGATHRSTSNEPQSPAVDSSHEIELSLTRHSLQQQQFLLNDEEVALMDSCVRMYSLWGEAVSQVRDISMEVHHTQQRTTQAQAGMATVAETLAMERKRLADCEMQLSHGKQLLEETQQAVDEFVAAAQTQKGKMGAAIAAVLEQGQSAFRTFAAEVSAAEARIRGLEASTDQANRQIAWMASELESTKVEDIEKLKESLLIQKSRTEALERRLRELRQVQRDMQLDSGFQRLGERAIRGMGLASMRDPESLFAPFVPASPPPLTALRSSVVKPRFGSELALPPMDSFSAILTQGNDVDDRSDAATVDRESRTPLSTSIADTLFSSIAQATAGSSERPMTPTTSNFFFQSQTDFSSRASSAVASSFQPLRSEGPIDFGMTLPVHPFS